MQRGRRHDALALAILTAVITLLFADVLAGVNSLFIRDIVNFHYPSKHVLREIVAGGEFPYWNPWYGAGQPMAANPQHEVFYPLTWLILLPNYRIAFHFLVLLHLYIAGFGMYALLRSMRLRPAAAFFGALSFALSGACLSYLNLLPFLFSASWLPLTCLFARRFLTTRAPADFAAASFFFGVIVLVGEPTTILQTGLLLGIFAIFRGWKNLGLRGSARAVALVGLISLTATLVAAVQFLPAIDHARDSVRARGFTFESVSDWSFPPLRLGEYFFPNFLGHVDFGGMPLYWGGSLYAHRSIPFLFSIYPGLLLTVLAVAGVLSRIRGTAIFLTISVVSVLLAAGNHTPLWDALFRAGVVRSLRYPEKFMLMGFFALVVFGAKALDAMLANEDIVRRRAVVVAFVVTVAAGVAAIASRTTAYASWFASFWSPRQSLLPEMLAASVLGWTLAAARGAGMTLLLRNAASGRRKLWLVVTGLFVLLDLGPLVFEAAPRMPPAFYDPPELARVFPANRTPWRLFHHAAMLTRRDVVDAYRTRHPDRFWYIRNGMFGLLPSLQGIRVALEGDYDQTGLTPTADFLQSMADLSFSRRDWFDVAASMSNVWYRAVFRDPREAFAAAHGDWRDLQPVGILALGHYPRYYFADRIETIANRQDFVRKLAGGQFGKKTAFLSTGGFAPAAGRVRRVSETANTARIDVSTAGRAFLVISVTPHKYWQITVDGHEVPAVVTNIGYQGIVVSSAGDHVVRMRYRNPLIPAGAAISLATLLALAVAFTRPATMRPSDDDAAR